MKTVSATAPEYWASYLINGDSSGLSLSEIEHADRFAQFLGGNIVSCEDMGFMWTHDAQRICGELAATCCEYTALIS